MITTLLLGLDVAATRLYPDRAPEDRRRLHATWYLVATAVVGPFGLLMVAGAAPLSGLLFGSRDQSLGVAMAGVSVIVGTWLVLAQAILRNQRRPLAYAAVAAGSLVLNAGLAIGLVVMWRADSAAVMTAGAISQTVAAGGAFALVARASIAAPTREAARALFRLGLPLAPAVAAVWIGDLANRAILLRSSTAAEVGLFAVAVRVASIAAIAVAGFQLAWQPRAFAAGVGRPALARLAVEARRVTVAVCGIAVALALVSPEVIRGLAGAEYSAALPALGFQLGFVIAAALFLTASMPSALGNSMGDIGLAGTAGVATSVAANVVLAPVFGSGGTAAATAIGQFAGVAVLVVRGSGRLPASLPWLPIAWITAAALVIIAISTGLPGGAPPVVRGGLAALFAVVLHREGTVRIAGQFVKERISR